MTAASRQLGLGVRLQRTRRGMTLDALGELVGLRKSALSELERGRRTTSIDDLLLLCDALDCGLLDLLSELDPEDRARLRV